MTTRHKSFHRNRRVVWPREQIASSVGSRAAHRFLAGAAVGTLLGLVGCGGVEVPSNDEVPCTFAVRRVDRVMVGELGVRLLDGEARATFERGTDQLRLSVRASLAFDGVATAADLRLSLAPGRYLDGRVYAGSPRPIVNARDTGRAVAIDCVFGAGDDAGARRAAVVRGLEVSCADVGTEPARAFEPQTNGELVAYDGAISLDLAVSVRAFGAAPLIGTEGERGFELAWSDESAISAAVEPIRPATPGEIAALSSGPSSAPARTTRPREETELIAVSNSYRGPAPVRPGAAVFADSELALRWAEVHETEGDFFVYWIYGAESVLIERAPGLWLPSASAWVSRDDVAIPTHENAWSPDHHSP
jgi:hypothetical protein